MLRRFSLVCLALLGCGESKTSFVPRDAFESDYGFFVKLEGSGAIASSVGPVLFDAWETVRVELPDDGAHRHLFLGWQDESLRRSIPSFDPAQSASLGLYAGRNSCASGMLSVNGERLRISLPEDTERLELQEDGAWTPVRTGTEAPPGLAEISLDVPADTTRCFPEAEPQFDAFGGVDPILQEGDLIHGRAITRKEARLRAVFRLPDDRVIAVSQYSILLIERGRRFEDLPGRAAALLDPMAGLGLRDIVVDVDLSRGDGALRILVSAAVEQLLETEGPGMLFELRLGEGGFESTRTATTVARPLEVLVLRPEDGRLVAGSRDGHILTMLPGGPVEDVLLPIVGDKRAEVFLTKLDDRPFAIAGVAQGVLLFGDATARRWEIDSTLPPGVTFRAFASTVKAGGPEFWIGDSKGGIFQKTPGGPWREVVAGAGPQYGACLVREEVCGWFEGVQSLRALVPLHDANPPRVLALLDGCSGVLRIRGDLACSTVSPMGARVLEAVAEQDGLRALHVSDRWVTIASSDGGLFELSRDPN